MYIFNKLNSILLKDIEIHYISTDSFEFHEDHAEY